MRRRKKKGAEDVKSAHLDGAGSARSFGSAAAGPVPEAFFVAPRNAPRISQPAPGPPCPEAGAAGGTSPGGILPLRPRIFLEEIRPHPRVGSPSLSPAGRSPRAGAGVPERCSPRQAPAGLAVPVEG